MRAPACTWSRRKSSRNSRRSWRSASAANHERAVRDRASPSARRSVIAATNDAALNATIARDAAEKGKLVNVVDAPELGSYITPAVHRTGDVVVAVSAGGVPTAAARIRDSIGAPVDQRYADAVRELASCSADQRCSRRASATDGRTRAVGARRRRFLRAGRGRRITAEGGRRMALTVVGINHRGARRSTFANAIAYRPSEIADAIVALRDEAALREAVVLSTCNRTELYLVEGEQDAAPAVWSALSARLGGEASEYGYVRRDREAVTHLFRVASGLDSMVVGEAQIHGQVRDAWETSRAHSGPMLNRLFQTSLLGGGTGAQRDVDGGAARRRSSSGRRVAALQADLRIARRASARWSPPAPGEMAELALECLGDQGVRTSIVANRTFERATEVAERHGAVAMHYDECWTALADVDVLVCSTSAPHAVVFTEHVRPALLEARAAVGHSAFSTVAMPGATWSPRSGRAARDVFLYNLDDLQAVVSANLERRRGELPSAEQLIAGEADRYWEWVAGLAAVPVLTEMRGPNGRRARRAEPERCACGTCCATCPRP